MICRAGVWSEMDSRYCRGAFATSIALGAPMTMNAAELWVVAALVPPTVMFLVWPNAPAVTVTDVLHAVNQQAKGGRS